MTIECDPRRQPLSSEGGYLVAEQWSDTEYTDIETGRFAAQSDDPLGGTDCAKNTLREMRSLTGDKRRPSSTQRTPKRCNR